MPSHDTRQTISFCEFFTCREYMYLMVLQHSYVRFTLDIYTSYRVRGVVKFCESGGCECKAQKNAKNLWLSIIATSESQNGGGGFKYSNWKRQLERQ